MTDLGLLPGATSGSASAVNGAGVVVGTMHFPGYTGNTRAFIYAGGVLRDLNSLIPAGSGWVLKQANGISGAGEIVGTGTVDGAIRGFILHPVPMIRPH